MGSQRTHLELQQVIYQFCAPQFNENKSQLKHNYIQCPSLMS